MPSARSVPATPGILRSPLLTAPAWPILLRLAAADMLATLALPALGIVEAWYLG